MKKLSRVKDSWRIRIDDYRVLYRSVDHEVHVEVFRVAHRREVY